MKMIKLLTYTLFFMLSISFFTTLASATTFSDTFEVNDGNWTGYTQRTPIANPINSTVLKVGYNYAYKYYYFGAAAANKDVNITFDTWSGIAWDNQDKLVIYLYTNGAYSTTAPDYYDIIPGTDGNKSYVKTSFSFPAKTDANGYVGFAIRTVHLATNTSDAALDNVTVTLLGTPPIMNPIPSQTVDQSTLLQLPLVTYVTQTEGDSILSYALSCSIAGTTFDSNTGLLYGYPINDGNYTCTASATDINGVSNEQTFTVSVIKSLLNTPPNILPVPDMSATVNTPISIDLSPYVIPTNADPVLSYTLTGSLPAGLNFNTATGIISGTPSAEVNATLILNATDKDGLSGNTSSFVLAVLAPTVDNNGFISFSLRYQKTFPGKMLTIGNTILVAPKDQTSGICKTYKNADYIKNASLTNADYELCAYYDDTNVKFPTTRASLDVNSTIKQVKWVGLYWQSVVKNGTDLAAMQIQLKHSKNNRYIPVGPTSLYSTQDIVPGYTSYAAFAELNATYFNDNNLTAGDVTVGDIPVVEGKIPSIGTYGAWTLVYIYEDPAEPLQNYSIYDGWQKVDATNNQVDIAISGFYTPKNAPSINAQLSVFTAEGDKQIAGDGLEVKPSLQTLTTTLLTNFDSSITSVPPFKRKPDPTNNQGIDIHTFNLGTTGKNIIKPEESSMLLRFYSKKLLGSNNQDTYFPSMIAFSAQLYTPQICYDYTASIGDTIRVGSALRDISTPTYGNKPLKIQFLIRSLEADFTYENAKANIEFNGASVLTHNHNYMEMSPPNDNSYYTYAGSAPLGNHTELESNASIGQVAMGGGVIGNPSNNGGVLAAKQSTYAVLGYDTHDVNLTTHFDILLNAQITFNPGDAPVDYHFSTGAASDSTNYIKRCPTSQIYSPVPFIVNVEHEGAVNEPLQTKYTLFTQVSNRPYNIDLVAYSGANYDTPYDFNSTVELELIDASAFLNDSTAGYDTTCQNPRTINGSIGKLIAFDPKGEKRHPVVIDPDITKGDWDTYPFSTAVRNAAFRAWLITNIDSNGTKHIITHQCTDRENIDGCFGKLYHERIDVNATVAGKCSAECSPNDNPLCYQCLKNHYATAVCSRDNFSIRPDSYLIDIYDDNDWDTTITPRLIAKNTPPYNNVTLAAGYDYKLDINSTNWGDDTQSKGYYNTEFYYQNNLPTIASAVYKGAIAALEFENSGTCDDNTSSTFALQFSNGSLYGAYNHFRFPNVGRYKMWLRDSNWTVVDHADYPFKPNFDSTKAPVDDCIKNNADAPQGSQKVGCWFESTQIANNKNFIHASVKPYYFSMSQIALKRYPDDTKNYTYYNDFTHPYYNDIVTKPIEHATIEYEGLLIAKGKDGVTTSNFTNGCAAEDVILRADINTTNRAYVDATTPLQQYLQHADPNSGLAKGIGANAYYDDRSLGFDKNLTLPKVAFDINATAQGIKPGEAKIFLHTTFKKQKSSPVDPIIVNYKALYADSPDAFSNADLKAKYIPQGSHKGYDRNITFYFAKVSPLQTFYDNVLESSKITPLSVDIYCSLSDCNATYNLTTDAVNGKVNWYSDTLYDKTQDGTTNLSVATIFGTPASPSVTPNTNIAFIHTNATRTDVNVSLAGSSRPTTVDIQIEPVPWFTYNPNDLKYGYPHYRVKFIGNSSWSGVGNTGNVVETTSNRDPSHRMNW